MGSDSSVVECILAKDDVAGSNPARCSTLMNTTPRGDIAVAAITLRLLEVGVIVLRPVTEMSRYDLVIDRGYGFERVQCKNAVFKNGAVIFRTYSVGVGGKPIRKSYVGQVDLFGVYCPTLKTSYLVPINDVGTAEGRLRVVSARNRQKARVRLASDYLI